MVLTTSAAEPELRSGLVGCEVEGWFNKRFVSLPFSDHCEPLVDDSADLQELLQFLEQRVERHAWSQAELRPRIPAPAFGAPMETFAFHILNLPPPIDELHSDLHPSCIQRAIRRAEREGLTCEEGSSDAMIETFYALLRSTRRRHGLPPQPLSWFRNLADCLGDALTIRIARQGTTPVAGLLTLFFKDTVVYKYGGSDARFHRFGAMAFLFWETIRDAKERGMSVLDLGRSDIDQPTLMTFKERLGAKRSDLHYYQYPGGSPATLRWPRRVAKAVFAHMPEPALTVAGRVLYRHLG